MKTYYFLIPLAFSLIFMSCSAKKSIITVDDLSGDKMLIIGVIEYDYSQLENKKKIRGIELFIDSKEKFSDFELPESYLSSENFIKQQFISTIGNRGDYELCLKKGVSNSAESDNLLTNLDMERSMATTSNNIIQKYTLNDGKIINIGKLVVKYTGGTMENSRITYSYSFHSVNNDTLALYAFKQTYPLIYNKYKGEMYVFKSEFDTCLDFVLNHISEGKRLRLQAYIADNPDRVTIVFKDLNSETQDKFVADIEKYTFEQLDEFLLKLE